MRIIFIILLTCVLIGKSLAQNCSCADKYAWVKETFEKNDAGFQYALEQKGEEEYKKLCDLYSVKVKGITDKNECHNALNSWLHFFRKGHLYLRNINSNDSPSEKTTQPVQQNQYKNWESYLYKEKEFSKYLANLKQPGVEGIWSSPPYVIGIKLVKDEYIGFIIESGNPDWTPDQVKLRINKNMSATYYVGDHSARKIEKTELLGVNYMQMENITFKRLQPNLPRDIELDREFKFLNAKEPLFEKIDENTAIIVIPSFSGSEKKAIDSVIIANKNTILNTKNLIIDLRYNGGGSDMSFQELLPFIYTNPIRVIGMIPLSTSLNNERFNEYLSDPDLSEEDRKEIKWELDTLNMHIGEFIDVGGKKIYETVLDTVYKYPENVGVIINGGCGSTTEQFLLAAKQSKKVKLFGTSTFGSLDISNMNSVVSPCKDFELGYCTTKSKRIPEFTIDGYGIQPDFFIDNTIPEHQWIKFVNSMLNNE